MNKELADSSAFTFCIHSRGCGKFSEVCDFPTVIEFSAHSKNMSITDRTAGHLGSVRSRRQLETDQQLLVPVSLLFYRQSKNCFVNSNY